MEKSQADGNVSSNEHVSQGLQGVPAFTTRSTQHSSNNEDGAARFEAIHTGHAKSSIEIQNSSNGSLSRTVTADSAFDHEHHRAISRVHSPMHDEEAEEVRRIATRLSHAESRATGTHRHSGLESDDFDDDSNDPALQPDSKAFDPEKWVRRMIDRFAAEGKHSYRTGVKFTDLSVSGSAAAIQLQQTVGSFLAAPLRPGDFLSFGKSKPHKQILRQFNGLIKAGELLIVLGRPGSGCSTLLKTMTGELHGLNIDEGSNISYNGIPQKQMKKEFKGEAIYNQEVDKHFPHLTVGQTLEFAAAMRTPSNRIQGMSREEFSAGISQVVMAICGLGHTYNTKVGNDFVRGVSGGERKRVSIAEMMLAGSPFSAWDNSTRGLDSATALKFVQALRRSSDLAGAANAVAIYQASQAIYDLFDKTTVLYEGRQIYFGPAAEAKSFFERQGWLCPQRQTTGDFLTSITNPAERKAREGMENKVPRTPEEFEQYWRQSPEFNALKAEIDEYSQQHPELSDEESRDKATHAVVQLRQNKNERQAKGVRPKSPYTISSGMQVRLLMKRAYQRIWGDASATVVQAVMNLVVALVLGSIFYGNPEATSGFYAKGAVLFLGVLSNALAAISEINNLYDQRPIVEKHASYAFYHPAAEALAGIVADMPIKLLTGTVFNVILYFMSGLHRTAGQFFLYYLIAYFTTIVMTVVFRTMAALTRTVSQAMTLAGILILALVMYSGFIIPSPTMKPWFGWIIYINPLYYAFEIMIANEFHGHDYTCSNIVPNYSPNIGDSWICTVVGAVAGQFTVSGDDFIEQNYEYYWSNAWRDFGILIAFLVGFLAIYLVACELNSATTSKAEVLVFQEGRVPAYLLDSNNASASSKSAQGRVDEEMPGGAGQKAESALEDAEGGANVNNVLAPQKDIFTWRNVVYDIHIKQEERRLLDNVAGWVKPGTLTALMGVSGAGKTTLLDVLAQRTTMGVVTGDMFVNGKPLDASFQRKTGYVQQQDLHLETATVRESLRFSAVLRQPKTVSKAEKYAFVEDVIQMLNMGDFADAVVGIPGEGLNVEQRKLLTIGVELAAKPKLLLFLDEPTSGLDSQSSWAIVSFLRKLADAGQAVLCTVHQPSAILFQEFDRLLFLAKGGKTVYFGNIGANSETLLDYFHANRAERHCGPEENPAEYMLDIVNNGNNAAGADWHSVWLSSPEREAVDLELDRIHSEKEREPADADDDESQHSEFAMPFSHQLIEVTYRVFQQYWRMPSYIFSKFALGIFPGLFIGFTFFVGDKTLAGMQNTLFSAFQIVTIFSSLVQQIQPLFITQRALYEVRERPSKAYTWKAFMTANILVEIPYQIITGVMIWACFYYPVVGAGQSSERQGLVLLLSVQLFVYASSYAHMTIAAMPDAQTAGAVVGIIMLMSMMFCGVLQTPEALPGFWIWMYRLSPFTYWISAIVSTMLHGQTVECSASETSIFNPPANQTCGTYLAEFLSDAGAAGALQNPDATESCRYCTTTVADDYLKGVGILWDERWRNFGILWAYVLFNIAVAVFTYWLFRVSHKKSATSSTEKKGKKGQAPK